ncbi:MAG TPA: hypothetical protein VHV10_13710, partial [Ktedonobacteraceae bacterium]|nr:hypothetical protein [Ktedonobacteraceae bacterium]
LGGLTCNRRASGWLTHPMVPNFASNVAPSVLRLVAGSGQVKPESDGQKSPPTHKPIPFKGSGP